MALIEHVFHIWISPSPSPDGGAWLRGTESTAKGLQLAVQAFARKRETAAVRLQPCLGRSRIGSSNCQPFECFAGQWPAARASSAVHQQKVIVANGTRVCFNLIAPLPLPKYSSGANVFIAGWTATPPCLLVSDQWIQLIPISRKCDCNQQFVRVRAEWVAHSSVLRQQACPVCILQVNSINSLSRQWLPGAITDHARQLKINLQVLKIN